MNAKHLFGRYSVAFSLFTLLVATSAPQAMATITGGSVSSGTGSFIELMPPLLNPLGPPNSVGEDTYDLPNLYAFNEDQNILLTSGLAVDVGTSPIIATTVVASHYIFFDPENTTSVEGTVDFDSEVIGIITTTSNLAASDFLANTGVNYLNPGLRGLEAGQDSASISGPMQVTVNFQASTPGDYIRVITLRSPGAIPEPSTLVLFSSFLLCTIGRRISNE